MISVTSRDRIVGFFKILAILFFIATGFIAMSYLPIKLPSTFQRSLSFLPGNWDADASANAKDSTEWRFDMWQMVLNSDRYIHDKIFGDGFGYLRADYERFNDINTGIAKLSEVEARQEMFMINGDFHSGPLGTIKFVGVVGLALLLPVFFLAVKMALNLIKTSLGTQFQFCAYFFSLPIIILPLFFFFVIGDYRQDFVTLLFYVGMMQMLEKSIEASKKA
jgi:hypothetical protein